MYYYILEPPRGKVVNRQEKIRDILGDLGIAGETVSPTAARTVEELAHLGVVKGYSTIVAVGSEALINKIITVIANEKTTTEVVLGIIPNDFDSDLAKRIGVNDLRSACNTLKFRKLETINLCLIEPNKYFLTEAVIENTRKREVFFALENLQGKAVADKIVIEPGLNITIHDPRFEGGMGKRFTNWLFKKAENDIYTSFFHTQKIHFESERDNLPIKVSGEIVAKTPATFANRVKSLKIIVSRDRIKAEEKYSGEKKSKN